MRLTITAAVAFALLATSALAELKYTGEGEDLKFDPSSISAEMQESYALMEQKCNNANCHTLARTALAIRDGIAPITSTPFTKKAAKAYGVKMMRRPDSNINRDEAKAIVKLLYWLIDEKEK